MRISTVVVPLTLIASSLGAATPFNLNKLYPRVAADRYPTRVIAGVTVIDTPIVRAADALARATSSEYVYKHVIRSWLYGVLEIQAASTNSTTGSIDLEVHAVAALLHDLGWDETPDSPYVTKYRRFEVDGAEAARQFVRDNADWDERRLQLLWDSIALHGEPSISQYKEPGVQVAGRGIMMDFTGPAYGVSNADYQKVVDEFPNDDLKSGFNETLIWLCVTKPNTTYDSWQQPWGDAYVANYSAIGSRLFDEVQALDS
ncbi:hypothetical protein GGR57DRAFT_371711 [Xylariaceae sp. FL1272]|nr:hypothetical protein GGR57DRAFT_371711 [Xylariaceae sp. FL1272]